MSKGRIEGHATMAGRSDGAPLLGSVDRVTALLRTASAMKAPTRCFGSPVEAHGFIKRFFAGSNNPKPFVWTVDPDCIILAAERVRQGFDPNHVTEQIPCGVNRSGFP
ncbi:hypothetical protein [Methylobacterium fujisawaense]|uniref:hypothetical protein n=1 Tax=Methylobacterium fujisawaense TaxID=107400 RepID=UPI002F3548E2